MVTSTRTRSVVVDTGRSPFARHKPVPLPAVEIDDAFWTPRMWVNREQTLPSQYRLLWETGRVDNLLRVAGKRTGDFTGRVFNDSDVYKWLEAASWALASSQTPEPGLEEMIDELVDAVAGAQHPDGYLNSFFSLDRAGDRWTNFDLHEMYCAGHLFQAAVAHRRATGSPHLLDVAIRFADHIDATFGPEGSGKRTGTDGHPEVEMALVELARETGEDRYIELARYLLAVRGNGFLGSAFDRFGAAYHQDHMPFRDLREMTGHAVRAVYLNAGAADLFAETGEAALALALERLWQNMTTRKMYVSGGIGSRYEGESFGENYELPNALAYTETCASIGSVMWNWRMLLIMGEARFADLLEWTLYNAVLPGASLDGQEYFYQNPLADEGAHRRQAWFGTACCPPNVARMLASLPGYLYSVTDDGIWVHLYAAGTAAVTLPDGRFVELRQQTAYPWDGQIELEVRGEGPFALHCRIPGWCKAGASLTVNGRDVDGAVLPGSYAEIQHDWRPGDVVRIDLPMAVRRLVSHPRVEENTGRTALARGPLLYCLEQVDNSEVDVREVALLDDAIVNAEFRADLLDGAVALTANARERPANDGWADALYRCLGDEGAPAAATPVTVTAIPYLLWANRDAGPMRVWIPRAAEIISS